MKATTSTKKGIALLLALATMLLLAAPALAASQKVYATTPLNLRSGPGTNYSIVGSLNQGQVVTRVGTTGGWSILEIGGKQVYASSNFLRVQSGSGGNTSGSTMYTTGRINVRSGPGTGYKVLATLNKGEPVSTLGAVGNWTIIKWNEGTAYMYTKYLKAGSGSTGSGNTGDILVSASGRMRATSNVNVRSGPSTSYSTVGWLAKGETVTRTGSIGNWTQVSYNNSRAYVHSSYLELISSGDETPGVTPVSGTVEATVDVNIRSGPGTNYSTLGTLYKGQRLTRTAIVGNWTRVNYNGKTAYVFTSYLRVVTVGPSATEKMYITATTALYSGPGASYNKVATLSPGDAVILIETIGGWARIEYGIYTGYVPANSLSSVAPSPNTPVAGLAYAPNGAYVYAGPGTSYTRLATLLPGDCAPCTLEVNGWTQVTYNSTIGYVRSADIVVLSSSAQTSFTTLEKQMYSKADNLPVYTIPADSSNVYRYGLMPLNEPVKQLAYNNVWTKIYADGRILYTRTENLKDSTGAPAPNPAAPIPGDTMVVTNANGALMYTDSGLTQRYSIYDNWNINLLADKIPYNTNIIFRSATGNAVEIFWATYNVTVYVSSSDIKLR